jgi:hypothetical protein
VQLDEGELLKTQGPAIEFLTTKADGEGATRWHRTVKWIRPDRSMGFVYVASGLMQSIWDIARFRYLGEKPESLNSWTRPSYEEFVASGEGDESAQILVESMDMELLYYVDPPAEPRSSRQ